MGSKKPLSSCRVTPPGSLKEIVGRAAFVFTSMLCTNPPLSWLEWHRMKRNIFCLMLGYYGTSLLHSIGLASIGCHSPKRLPRVQPKWKKSSKLLCSNIFSLLVQAICISFRQTLIVTAVVKPALFFHVFFLLAKAAEGATKGHKDHAEVHVPKANNNGHPLQHRFTVISISIETLGNAIRQQDDPTNENHDVDCHGLVIAEDMLDTGKWVGSSMLVSLWDCKVAVVYRLLFDIASFDRSFEGCWGLTNLVDDVQGRRHMDQRKDTVGDHPIHDTAICCEAHKTINHPWHVQSKGKRQVGEEGAGDYISECMASTATSFAGESNDFPDSITRCFQELSDSRTQYGSHYCSCGCFWLRIGW